MLHFLSFHSPLFFHVRDAIIAGSTGRMAMILLIYIGPFIGLPRIDAVSMLGSLAAPTKEAAVTLGGAIHFSLGIVFALIYAALWSIGIGSPTWYWGMLFGTVHGLLVISLLFVTMRLVPQLSQYFNTLGVMLAILLNHIVFGVVVAVVYIS
ncbi:MAG TPA: DUF6789 family protein [Ktedonobacteraceae bacterium]|nr:DUF6789 family protein [Ktedonobacteraceae bacterium]